MPRVQLLHWKRDEAATHLERLRAAGCQVDYDEQFRPALMKRWRESPPDAFVIDLSRLPSHGREIAIALRQSPRTRLVPIVFCCGEPEKVARVQRDLPDASYGPLRNLPSRLLRALSTPLANPIKPTQMMDRYASRTAAQKLGITHSSTVLAIDPPRDLLHLLGELPAGVEVLENRPIEAPSITLCFIEDVPSLFRKVSDIRPLAGRSKLWILWRKGGSSARGEVTETLIRDTALDLGLVDYKICSVNATWSAMLFARKR